MSQNASIKQAFIKCQHTKGKESIGTLKQPNGEGEVEERAEHFLTCFKKKKKKNTKKCSKYRQSQAGSGGLLRKGHFVWVGVASIFTKLISHLLNCKQLLA